MSTEAFDVIYAAQFCPICAGAVVDVADLTEAERLTTTTTEEGTT